MALPRAARDAARTIADYGTVYPLHMKGVTAFHAKFTKNYAYLMTASHTLEKTHSTLQEKFQRNWDEREDPLWWGAIAFKSFENKRTVRSWVTRRLREAFKESLKKAGYAPDGNRIEGDGEPLRGTCQLLPKEPILKMKFADVLGQTDSLVKEIIRRQDMVERNRGNGVDRKTRVKNYKAMMQANASPQIPPKPVVKIIKF